MRDAWHDIVWMVLTYLDYIGIPSDTFYLIVSVLAVLIGAFLIFRSRDDLSGPTVTRQENLDPLRQAFEQGLMTEQEYLRVRDAADRTEDHSDPDFDPGRPKSLDPLRQAVEKGLITEEEYLRLRDANRPGASPAPADSTSPRKPSAPTPPG
jgi:hypothetical protein